MISSVNVERIQRDRLPLINMDRVATPGSRSALANAIKSGFSEWGFVIVENHPINLDLIDHAFSLITEFFASPSSRKAILDYRLIDQGKYGSVGFYPFRTEIAVGSKEPDLKEFLHFGRDVVGDRDLDGYYGRNAWPDWIPGFRPLFEELYEAFSRCGDTLISAVAEAYGLDPVYVNKLKDRGNSILRAIHYPPVLSGTSAMRAAPHTGINLLDILPPSTVSGLQFCTPDGRWVVPDRFERQWMTVNVGEMLSYLTGGHLPPTLHRVVNDQDGSDLRDRYTIAYFYHANHTVSLNPLPDDNGVSAPSRLGGEWVLERIREIGLQPGQSQK